MPGGRTRRAGAARERVLHHLDQVGERAQVAIGGGGEGVLHQMVAGDVHRIDQVHRRGDLVIRARVVGPSALPPHRPRVERGGVGAHRPRRLGVAAHHVGERPQERRHVRALLLQQCEQVVDERAVHRVVVVAVGTEAELGAHHVQPVRRVPLGEAVQRCRGQFDRGLLRVGDERQQGLGEAGQVPLGDARLLTVRVTTAVVDGAEHRGVVVAIHERARPVVDRLARDRHVVGVHHAMDEADRHPPCDQRRLGLGHGVEQRKGRVVVLGGGGVVPLDGVAGEVGEQLPIAGVGRVLERTDAQVARGHASQHRARQRPRVAGDVLARRAHGQGPRGGDAERVHRLADDVLAQHRPHSCLAVAAASERGAARTFQVQVAADAGHPAVCLAVRRADEFAQQQRPAVTEAG